MSRTKVLVVEDEPLIAIDIETVLESLGCDIVGPTAFLAEAFDLATRESFDCAILDVNVRGGPITPVAQLLNERGIPVLITTGYSDWALAEALTNVPRLQKPYTTEQLEDEVRLLRARVPHGSAQNS